MTCRLAFPGAGQIGWLYRVSSPILVGIGLAVSAVTAVAQIPAALVVDITGPSDPVVEAFDELEVGATVKLGPETEITVMHYASCRELSLRGGTVVVGADRLDYPGARILGGRAGDCPTPVTVRETALVGAGVVLRSVTPRPEVSPTPSFLVAVADRAYDELLIQDGCDVIIRRPIRGARVAWNAADPPLAPGDYSVVLSGQAQTIHMARIRVTAGGPGLIILRP